MTRIGYARVSTDDQHPEVQADRLTAAGCERVFSDHGVSGKLARRPAWDELLAYARRGDVLVTVRLDRIGRSVRNLVDVVTDLGERGIDLVVLDQAIDTTTPAGRMMFHVLAAISQFEADLIRERTMDGLAAARARGRTGGRPAALSAEQSALAAALFDERGPDGKRARTVQDIADLLSVSRGTVYSSIGRARASG